MGNSLRIPYVHQPFSALVDFSFGAGNRALFNWRVFPAPPAGSAGFFMLDYFIAAYNGSGYGLAVDGDIVFKVKERKPGGRKSIFWALRGHNRYSRVFLGVYYYS
jgi:hypothetical protein